MYIIQLLMAMIERSGDDGKQEGMSISRVCPTGKQFIEQGLTKRNKLLKLVTCCSISAASPTNIINTPSTRKS